MSRRRLMMALLGLALAAPLISCGRKGPLELPPDDGAEDQRKKPTGS